MTIPVATLKRTPLYPAHVAGGGRLVPFGGWELPVQYRGIPQEHRAVREQVGLFDISHMGEIQVSGPGARPALNRLLTNDVNRLRPGQAQYTLLCNPAGGIIDDLIVYCLEPDRYLLVVNAANNDVDLDWMTTQAGETATFDDQGDQTAAVALQGPAAARVLPEAAGLERFTMAELEIDGLTTRVARTGYTGEDGFEILLPAADAVAAWDRLLARGQPHGLVPCGLGARDVLRLEMGYPLHGNDITAETTPFEAGLDRFVALDKKCDFIGRPALEQQRSDGVTRRLVAFVMTDKSPPPRPHYRILAAGEPVGEVTSGGPSPSLGTGIGLGYVETGQAANWTQLEIEIRGRVFPAEIRAKPLYRKPKST